MVKYFDDDLVTHINKMFPKLTKSEKRVADYVMKNMEKTQYLSISELAEACSVADATITRFSYKLGFAGFNAFKLSLARTTANRNGSPKTVMDPQISGGHKVVIDEHLKMNIQALEQTKMHFNEQQYLEAVKLLQNARQVYCMGQGGSMIMAMEAYSLFVTISSKFCMVQDFHIQAMTATHLKKNDVILFFSYSAATKELTELMNILEKSECKIILVTRYPSTPLAKKASTVLQCGSNESSLRSGSVQARIAQLFVIELLYEYFIASSPDEMKSQREKSVDVITNRLT